MSKGTVVRHLGAGDLNRAFGLERRFLLRSEDTGGASTVFSEDVPPGMGPPLHVHHRERETFVVLAGEIRFQCGSEDHLLESGGLISIAPGVHHTFKNEAEVTARVIVTLTPGGAEKFFEAVEKEALQPPADMPRIADIAAQHGLEFVGPPL